MKLKINTFILNIFRGTYENMYSTMLFTVLYANKTCVNKNNIFIKAFYSTCKQTVDKNAMKRRKVTNLQMFSKEFRKFF